MARVTARDITQMKAKGEKIPMITAYDYTSARLADEAGVPLLLVGDSLGMVVLGYDSTIPVTMEDMVHHLKAVSRGAQRAHIVGDLPFMTYHVDAGQALSNADTERHQRVPPLRPMQLADGGQGQPGAGCA